MCIRSRQSKRDVQSIVPLQVTHILIKKKIKFSVAIAIVYVICVQCIRSIIHSLYYKQKNSCHIYEMEFLRESSHLHIIPSLRTFCITIINSFPLLISLFFRLICGAHYNITLLSRNVYEFSVQLTQLLLCKRYNDFVEIFILFIKIEDFSFVSIRFLCTFADFYREM